MKMTNVLSLFLALALIMASTLIMKPVYAQNPVYISVEPVAIAPLTDTNASLYGLETPPTPSPVGKNFTVEIHLRNATVDNVANGVGGVEVHFNFTSILSYCQPTGFVDMVGQPGGVLVSPILFGISPGFYKADGITKVNTPPYTDAVLYKVAGASTGGAWNEADGLVAKINFTITKQPQSSLGETDAFLRLVNSFTDLTDLFATLVNHDRVQGTLTIDATPQVQQNYTLTVNVVGSGSVAKNPSSATYAGGTVVTLTASPAVNWTFHLWSGDLTGALNPINITMDANKTVTATFAKSGDFNNDGKINLQDLMRLALSYGMNSTSPLWTEAAPPWGAPSEADFNHDGKINLVDLVTLAVYYDSSPL